MATEMAIERQLFTLPKTCVVTGDVYEVTKKFTKFRRHALRPDVINKKINVVRPVNLASFRPGIKSRTSPSIKIIKTNKIPADMGAM